MVNFRKNKTDGEPKVHNENDEITDVLLMDQDEVPESKAEKVGDVIYELIEEDQNTEQNTPEIANAAVNKQIKELQQTQEFISLQLKEATVATDKLTRKLQKERQTKRASVTSYVGLAMGGLALIIAVTAALFLGSLHRDVKDLTATLEGNTHSSSITAPVDIKDINTRIDELATKFDMLLTGQGNMDEALEATSILKKQLKELANDHSSSSKSKTAVVKPSIKLKSQVKQKTSKNSPRITTKWQPKKSVTTDKTVKTSIITKTSSQKKNTAVKASLKKPEEKIATTSKPAASKTQAIAITPKTAISIEKRGKDGSLLKVPAKTVSLTQNTEKKAVTKNKTKDWVVGLGSYKNAATAKEKASSYRKSGVPAIVVKVNAQGQVWHRVSTKSFNSKEEASAYSTQVKQKLNIKSTLVTNH
ncbi:MAG: hypothetical protein GQ569_15065 [Methylococcaceae bacterium]|nr:hypothetical protein [Methylococcaceae bacterium]